MQVHFGTESLLPEWPASVACVGTFDGVHLGHQEVIRQAVGDALAKELPAILITFDRHPAAVLAPDRCPKALANLDQNLKRFEILGVSIVLVLKFDRGLSETPAIDFFETILQRAARAQEIVVGHDFAFGKGREGNPEWLSHRIQTKVVPPFEMEGSRVSSTDIRSALAEGRVEDAARWLGRNYELEGVVVPGERVGRTLGYPTANLARSADVVVPADGVYSGVCHLGSESYTSAISIGERPTFDGRRRVIEAFLLDYPGDSLYGRSIKIEFALRIRSQVKFESEQALMHQMADDILRVRSVQLT